ncbi:MAG TPA: hypothetical protein PLN69_11635 [bacterium]|mgnify:CR=1 FL=1|nr:hypothetical protein [bacterium]
MKKAGEIIIISRDVWSDVRRRRHFLAKEWARDHRILFVEPPVSVPRLIAGMPNIPNLTEESKSNILGPPRKVAENIFVLTPADPFPNSVPGLGGLNSMLYRMHIRDAARKLGFDNPVLWITPEYGVCVPRFIKHRCAVYDITDDWQHADIPPAQRKKIRKQASALLKKADIVFTVSPNLKADREKSRADVIYMPNGVDPAMYNIENPPVPDQLENIPEPRIGYTGTLHADRIDAELVMSISKLAGGDYSLVFVGPNHLPAETVSKLEALPNVYLITGQPYDALPGFVAHFAACFIPHALTPFTHSLDPIKAYEFLAAGKPIISVPLDGLAPLADFISFATAAEEFDAAVRSAIHADEPETIAARRAEAEKNSWSIRADEIIKIITDRQHSST